MLVVAGAWIFVRNANDSWTNERRSDVQSQSAQRPPSTCAARECEQSGHFFVVLDVIAFVRIKIGAVDRNLSFDRYNHLLIPVELPTVVKASTLFSV